jgi:sensor domain CHASE-containing protein/anti-anti-sigma regulatory factor
MLNNGTPSQPPARAGLAPAALPENAPQHFSSLRIRLSLIVVAVIVVLLVMLYIPLRLTVLSAFADREQQSMKDNLKRSRLALQLRLDEMGTKIKDYAQWDGTYDLMADPSPAAVSEYTTSNLDDEILKNLGANVVVVVDAQGTVILSKSLAVDFTTPAPLPAELAALLTTASFKFLDPNTQSASRLGVVRTADTAMLLSVSAVLPTGASGTPRGAMAFGRILTQEEVDKLAQISDLKLTVHSLDPARPLGDVAPAAPLPGEVLSDLQAGQEETIKPVSANEIVGATLIKDIQGQPALALKVDSNRDILTQGQRSSNYFMAALIVMALVLSLVVTALLQRFVLSRLLRLNREVGVIGVDSDTAERVTVQGSDELAQLSLSINTMLAALQRAQQEHQVSDEERARLKDGLIQAQRATLEKLSTPVIPISDTVIVMPLIGDIDPDRSRLILETLLHGISQMRTRTAIIDITGIFGVNEEVITLLTRMVGTVRLLGTELILTGISAEVARMLAKRPGVLHGVMTYSNLQQAIVYALKA